MSDTSAEKRKLSKKAKIILGTAVLLLILTLCGIFISMYAKTLVTEGTVDLSPEPVALTAIPENAEETIAYIQRLVDSAKDNSAVSVDVSSSLSIDENAMEANGTDAELNILKFAKNSVLEKATELYPSHDGTFGDGFADFPEIDISAADATQVALAAGFKNDLGEDEETDYYYFNILMPDFSYPVSNTSPIFGTFDMDKIPDIISLIKAKTAKMLIVTASDIACTGFKIEGRANKFDDKLDYISFTRSYTVKLTVKFLGNYESFGVTEITFPYTAVQKYDYTWAGLKIIQDKMSLFKNEEELIGIEAIIAEDGTAEDYELSFTSSNESIATIDSDGSIRGVAVSTEPALITATLKYMGNTYTDTCEVYVTVPVSRLNVSPSELSLKQGETGQIDCVFKPDDATIKDVLWFTEDEKIAAVDENGVVTGIKAGTVKVYAVSVDGSFKSSCTVMVTDN